jgi:RNA polymerase sigma-70 factor (ECF subfamily)
MNTRSHEPDDVDESLLKRAREGDKEAVDLLLSLYRDRLRQMVAMRIDPAIHPRVDASDIVQETLIEANRRMSEFLDRKPMPFELWLRKTAIERLIMERRKHHGAAGRSVTREIPLPENSSMLLADRLLARDPSPSQSINRREAARAIQRALAKLSDQDREIVLMRWIEGLCYSDIASVLGIEEATARKRHGRILIRLHRLLKE